SYAEQVVVPTSAAVKVIDVVGHLDRGGRRHHDLLGVAAQRHGPGHPVTLGEPGDARAHRGHHAGTFDAVGERKVGGVEAGPVVDVDEVHPGDGEVDQDLSFARLTDLDVGVGHDLRATVLAYLNASGHTCLSSASPSVAAT